MATKKQALDALAAVMATYEVGMRHPEEQDALTVIISQQRELIRAALVDDWEQAQGNKAKTAGIREERKARADQAAAVRAQAVDYFEQQLAAGVDRRVAVTRTAKHVQRAEGTIKNWVRK